MSAGRDENQRPQFPVTCSFYYLSWYPVGLNQNFFLFLLGIGQGKERKREKKGRKERRGEREELEG